MVNRVTNEFEVDAEPARVMKALVDIDGLPEWSSGHKNASVETRWDDGLPRVVHADLSVVGATDHQVLEYSWSGDESMRWELLSSTVQKSQIGTYTLTPTDSRRHPREDGDRVRPQDQDARFRGEPRGEGCDGAQRQATAGVRGEALSRRRGYGGRAARPSLPRQGVAAVALPGRRYAPRVLRRCATEGTPHHRFRSSGVPSVPQ